MKIEVWSVGNTKFTADSKHQEPMIREAIDQRGDVAEVIADYTNTERSNIDCDDYARVTGDVPGLVLFEGWLTGDRNAPPPAGAAERPSVAFVAITRDQVADSLEGLEVRVFDGDRSFSTTLVGPGDVADAIMADAASPTAEDYDHAAEIMRLRGQLEAVRAIAEPYAGDVKVGASSTTVLAQAVLDQLDPE